MQYHTWLNISSNAGSPVEGRLADEYIFLVARYLAVRSRWICQALWRIISSLRQVTLLVTYRAALAYMIPGLLGVMYIGFKGENEKREKGGGGSLFGSP